MADIESKAAPTLSTVAGIGGGTGLLGLANYIPDSYPALKHIAIYASPTATLVIKWIWIFLSFWITSFITKKSADYGLRKMRVLRDEAVNDPHSTDEHKRDMQEQCEKLEKLAAASIAASVKTVQQQFGQRDED